MAVHYGLDIHNNNNNNDNKITSDADDEETIRLTYDRGCSCNRRCSKLYTFAVYRDTVLMCGELTNEQLDLLIIGELLACTDSESRRADYMFRGIPVCRTTFCIMHDISDKRLENITTHFKTNGIAPRKHRSKKQKRANNTTSEDVIYQFSEFLKIYADVHAIGGQRDPSDHKNNRVLILPTFLTKQKVYQEYVKDCANANREYMSEKSFFNYWNELHPYITHKNNSYINSQPRNNKDFITNSDLIPRQEGKTKFAQLQRVEYSKASEDRGFNFPTMCRKEITTSDPTPIVLVGPASSYDNESSNGTSYPFHYRNTMVPPSEVTSAQDPLNQIDDDIIVVKEEELDDSVDEEDERRMQLLMSFPEDLSSPQRKKKKFSKYFNGIITEITDEMAAEIRRKLREVNLHHKEEEILTEIKASIGPRHKLSLKLLRLIFTKEELATQKIPKDNEKLMLVKEFSFVRCREELGELKDISWKDVVTRIYSRQRNLRNAKAPGGSLTPDTM